MLKIYHTLTGFLIYCSSFASITRSLQRHKNHLLVCNKNSRVYANFKDVDRKARGHFNFEPVFNKIPSRMERDNVTLWLEQ